MFRLFYLICFLLVVNFVNAQFSSYCNTSYSLNNSHEMLKQINLNGMVISGPAQNAACASYTANLDTIHISSCDSSLSFYIHYSRCNLFTSGGASSRGVKIFVDWNEDGSFQGTGETVYYQDILAGTWQNWLLTGNIFANIPQGVSSGNKAMRIVFSRVGGNNTFANSASITSCGTYEYGETEDFLINFSNCNAFEIDAGPDEVICEGDSIQLNATSVTGAVYTWTPNNSLSSNIVNNPWAYPTTTTQYIVTVDSAAGFIDSDTVIIYVLPYPVLSVSNDQNICHGATPSQMTVNNINGAFYTWTPNTFLNISSGFAFQGANNPLFTSSLTSSQQYIVSVSLAGCTSLDTININVNPVPIIDSVIYVNPLCSGDNVSIETFTTPMSNNYQYQQNISGSWLNMTSPGMNTINPINVILNNTTQFRVRVVENWPGCTISNFYNFTIPVINVYPQSIIHY